MNLFPMVVARGNAFIVRKINLCDLEKCGWQINLLHQYRYYGPSKRNRMLYIYIYIYIYIYKSYYPL